MSRRLRVAGERWVPGSRGRERREQVRNKDDCEGGC
jgi:hypothetical protein